MTDLLNPYASRGKRTVEITASFPGSALPSDEFNNPKSMTLTQRMKSHDVLVLRYQVEMPDASRLLRTGSPVTVTWGTTNVNESRTWVGYVHTTTPRKTGNTSGTTEIVCVSPSMILKQAAQDTWINRPVMVVAADIIQGAGLDAKVDTMERSAFLDQLLNGEVEICPFSWSDISFDFGSAVGIYMNSNCIGMSGNYGRYNNPRADELIALGNCASGTSSTA